MANPKYLGSLSEPFFHLKYEVILIQLNIFLLLTLGNQIGVQSIFEQSWNTLGRASLWRKQRASPSLDGIPRGRTGRRKVGEGTLKE